MKPHNIILWVMIILILSFIFQIYVSSKVSNIDVINNNINFNKKNKIIFGVGEHTLTENDAKVISNAGIKMLRTDFLWAEIEPSKGDWNFNYYDEIVARANKYNISILGILDYSAPWASSGISLEQGRGQYPPDNIEDYARFVAATIDRYDNSITYWEIWNEPNINIFWEPKPDPVKYTKLLKAAYKAGKEINPNIKILLGGISEIDLKFIREVYKNGGKDFFDIMSIHPYRQPKSPVSYPSLKFELEKLKSLMDKYSDNKPVWITEIGWQTGGSDRISVEQQEKFLRETVDIIKHTKFVDAIFWYELRDEGQDKDDHLQNFGLLYNNFEPKPAYNAYKEIIEENKR